MQRFNAASSTNAISNIPVGAVLPQRDANRTDAGLSLQNFPLSSRRTSQLSVYKLRCDREQLNSRLGPPDFHPQTPNCPEETLPKENVQSGYKETVEGIEEAREISLTQVQAFSKPVVVKCREAIRKRLRAINEARAQKRKAGQVYGIPLSGSLLTKAGVFPEQKPCSEDFRKKWIEALSQPHKRLSSLADHVPHGYRKKFLFEVLIRNNVPLLRATWFIRITYLNQVRPGPTNISSASGDKTQISRTELWTKDVVDYMQYLLDEFLMRSNSLSSSNKDHSPQLMYSASQMYKIESTTAINSDGSEPSFHFKWWYVVRIIQWHNSERLILSSYIIDWVLSQLQDKESLEIFQLMLPIIFGLIEVIVTCQSYVRTLVIASTRFIQHPSPRTTDHLDNSRKVYATYSINELLRYLIVAVPDTFVAFDCSPLLSSVASATMNDGSLLMKLPWRMKSDTIRSQCFPSSLSSIVSSIQKHSDCLANVVTPGHPGHNMAKVIHSLDEALLRGDVTPPYRLLFDAPFEGIATENWVQEISLQLRLSLTCIGTVVPSLICSILFLCEWATSDFRDCRTPPHHQKHTSGRDYLQIYIAIRVLRLKLKAMEGPGRGKPEVSSREKNNLSTSEIFRSPGPLHDIIVCWIDQHTVRNGEGFKLLQLFIMEMTRSGIFHPHAYVRQLITSGVVDGEDSQVDMERRKRHCRVLKYLPPPFVRTALEEARIFKGPSLAEGMRVYGTERRLVLRNPATRKSPRLRTCKTSKTRTVVEDINSTIALLLHFPRTSPPSDVRMDEFLGCDVISAGVLGAQDGGFSEECWKAKRQKISDEKNVWNQGNSPNPSDDDDSWWVKRPPNKPFYSLKEDPTAKLAKKVPRGRQKVVRKTQSLTQLAAARMESSQEASTSHVCDSKIVCNHHYHFSTVGRGASKMAETGRGGCYGDLISVGRSLSRMRFIEKTTVTGRLMATVKYLVEDSEREVPKVPHLNKPCSPSEERGSVRWKLGEDELLTILYLMDICNDELSAVRFLLRLLPKVLCSPGPTIHGGQAMVMLPRAVLENCTCEISEAFLLTSLRRYENVLVATDLIPEFLSTAIHRAVAAMASGGRVLSTPSLVYAKYLLRKYSTVPSISEWEAKFKSTCDKRFLSELDSGKFIEADAGFSVGVALSGADDPDDYLRQKLSTFRLSRVGLGMREVVQRHVEDAFHYFVGKERKLSASGGQKNLFPGKWDESRQISKQIIMGLTECIRQTGGAAQEGDPSLVSSAVSAIVYNAGLAFSKLPDFSSTADPPSAPTSLTSSAGWYVARQILRVHITCLCLLKEVLGERHSRVFEVALAAEASSSIAVAFSPSKGPSRPTFHVSPDPHDSAASVTGSDTPGNPSSSSKVWSGRPAKIAAAISALVIGAVLQGVASLERMIAVFRLKEGLDIVHFIRSGRCTSNGTARAVSQLRADGTVEVCTHWFRLLIGNCRTVFDGLLVELLGEPAIAALSGLQRTLPVGVVLPPAYSIFAFLMWRSFALDDTQQLYQSLSAAIIDLLKHPPFREACLKDTQCLYDVMAADTTDSDFASFLDQIGTDVPTRVGSFIPLRARLFLDSIIDGTLSGFRPNQCRGRPGSGFGDQIVNLLDTLQPAKFHWQWVELRLLLNEQAVAEKLESHDTSLVDALRSILPHSEKAAASENENNFVQIVLTRLLVRPDAAPLFAEVIHRFGQSLEDSVLLQAKWFLGGPDVLFGRKSINQRLVNIAEGKGLSTEPGFWRPWGWSDPDPSPSPEKGEQNKYDLSLLEEGEVVEESVGSKTCAKVASRVSGVDFQPNLTEKALVELILPCIDQCSDESRLTFASDLIKQMNNIEQQINGFSRGMNKNAGIILPSGDSSPIKANNRKTVRSGSPGQSRWSPGGTEVMLPPPAALRASLTLRLQFITRLLPVICSERESSGRNMRHTLASVILHLLGSRTIYEEADPSQTSVSRREAEVSYSHVGSPTDLYGDGLFDRMLFLFHGLMSSFRPVWLKMKPGVKFINESSKDFPIFDREVAEGLRNDLEQMHLPDTIRRRIESAMPLAAPSLRCSAPSPPPVNLPQKTQFPTRTGPVLQAKSKPPVLDPEPDVDPWTVLEDGPGSGPGPTLSGDASNIRASHLLRSAVRFRRKDLSYVGTVDDDS